MDLDIVELWRYKGEGRANAVFSYLGKEPQLVSVISDARCQVHLLVH